MARNSDCPVDVILRYDLVMPYAVACPKCGSRFGLPDDLFKRKFAGNLVGVRCRNCKAEIQVDSTDLSLEQLGEGVARASAETQHAEAEQKRIADELQRKEETIANLRLQLEKETEGSRGHQRIVAKLESQIAETEAARREKEAADQDVSHRQAIQKGMEDFLDRTKEIRSELGRLRGEARQHRSEVELAWRCPMLDEDAQKARRNLVVLSAVTVFANMLQIVPEKVAALGVEFDSVQRRNWHLAMGLILGYSLLSFGLKSYHSWRAWRDGILGNRNAMKVFERELPSYVNEDKTIKAFLAHTGRSQVVLVSADIFLPSAVALFALCSSVLFGDPERPIPSPASNTPLLLECKPASRQSP